MERSGKCKQLYSTLWLNTVHPVTSFQPIRMLDFIYPYYNSKFRTKFTAPKNGVLFFNMLRVIIFLQYRSRPLRNSAHTHCTCLKHTAVTRLLPDQYLSNSVILFTTHLSFILSNMI